MRLPAIVEELHSGLPTELPMAIFISYQQHGGSPEKTIVIHRHTQDAIFPKVNLTLISSLTSIQETIVPISKIQDDPLPGFRQSQNQVIYT